MEEILDDTFCVVQKGTEDDLLNHLNSVRDCIKFTMEMERNNKLPFLDVMLERDFDGMLTSTV